MKHPRLRAAAMAGALASSLALASAPTAWAGADPFIGEVMLLGGSWCPRDWAPADGRLLPINNNPALFSLIGNYYGGDGRTNFALPDLRGRTPIGAGQGPGLAPYQLGQKGGAESVTLSADQKPAQTNGGNQPVHIRDPYLAMTWCIALQGQYPSHP
ncbi:MAG: tail fiber protein [Alphaproteobacteria bacterium]|nr:tail fiber protein [Alphaproteobacteria bacterium]